MWGGRFAGGPAAVMREINASIAVDKRLWREDIAASRAHAAMQCASLLREAMWSMVSELHLAAPGADYVGYTAENLGRLDEALDHYRTEYGKTAS